MNKSTGKVRKLIEDYVSIAIQIIALGRKNNCASRVSVDINGDITYKG